MRNLNITAAYATLKFNQLIAELNDDFLSILKASEDGYKTQIEVNENEGFKIEVIMKNGLIRINHIQVYSQLEVYKIITQVTLALDPQSNSLFQAFPIEVFIFDYDNENPIYAKLITGNPIRVIGDMLTEIADDNETEPEEDGVESDERINSVTIQQY